MTKAFKTFNGRMKPDPIRKRLAPSPRYTVWVPVLLSIGLCGFWLLMLALINR